MNYTKKSWSPEEETEMLSSIRRGEAFETISQRHHRTPNAIKLRFAMVCKKDMESTGKGVGDICREYHMKEEQLLKHINDLETIQRKNNIQSAPLSQNISSSDLADITIIKEEILLVNEKLDKVCRHVKKLLEISKKKKSPSRRI